MDRKLITQEYYAMVVDKNGNMPPMRRDEANAGLVVGGFMDLLFNEIIMVEKKKITVVKELPQELKPISTLYEYLKGKSRSIGKLMTDYYTGSRIKQMIAEVGESLFVDGKAEKGEGGIFGSKTTYVPEKGYKDELVAAVKSAVTGDGELTSHDAALICILQETKNLGSYFTKTERSELKARLKEMKKNPQNKQLREMINYVTDWITTIMACVLTYSV